MFWPGWAAWPARSTKPTTAPNCPPPASKPWTSSPPASIAPPMPGNPWRVWGSTWTPSRPWWTGSSSAALSAPASRPWLRRPAAETLWGSQSWLQPAFSRPSAGREGSRMAQEPPERRLRARLPAPRLLSRKAPPCASERSSDTQPPLRDRPALAHRGHEVLVSLHVVGDLHLRRIVFQLAFHSKGDHAEQHPLHERRRHVEVGTGRVASLASPDPIPVVQGRGPRPA